MSELSLYAVFGGDLEVLSVPEGAADVHELFTRASWTDRGTPAIYSALRSYHHERFLRLDAHLERSRRCVERAGWTTRFAFGGLTRALAQAVRARTPGDVRVRFDLFERPIQLGGVTTQVLLGIAPHTPVAPALLSDGVRLGLAPPGLARPVPLIKYSDWVEARRVCEAHAPGMYEHLLLDEAGCILEGTSSNFYVVRDGVLVTAGDGVLEGITRQITLERAAARGVPIELRRVPVAQLGECEEAFITSSTREVVPVSQVGGVRIAEGKPGTITQALMADYSAYAEASAKLAEERTT